MTTITLVQLVAPAQLATSDAALYSCPTQTTAKIGRAVFTNTSASVATTISAGITPGVALGASTTLISARPIAAGESYVAPELAGAVLPAGSQIRAFAGTTTVTFTASGITAV